MIRKKTSKRLGFREKYAVERKVKEHHAKMRKNSKKLAKSGIRPHKGKKPTIPNSFPDKETLINEMEAEFISKETL